MGILLICIALVFIGAILKSIWDDCILVFMLSVLLLFICIACLLYIPYEVRGEITEFKSVAVSLYNARSSEESIENTALQLEIIESNQWLANIQYKNSTMMFNIFIPNEVDELIPIE